MANGYGASMQTVLPTMKTTKPVSGNAPITTAGCAWKSSKDSNYHVNPSLINTFLANCIILGQNSICLEM